MRPPDEPVRIQCYAGSRADETPRRLWAGDRWHDLTVLDRWVTEAAESGHRLRHFRVMLQDATPGMLYLDEGLDLWFWRRRPAKCR